MRRLLPLLAAARLLSSSGVASAAPCAAKAASRAAASARFGAYASDGPYPVGTATVANLRRSFGNWSWSPVKKLLAALVDPIPGLSPPEYPTFNALLTYPASPSAAAAGDDESSVEFAAPLEGDAPRFALLGFMPGWSCNAQLYAPLFRRLASHGVAVVAPLFNDDLPNPFTSIEAWDFPDEIDQLVSSMRAVAAAWPASVDSSRQGLCGHSAGGGSALQAAAQMARAGDAVTAIMTLGAWINTASCPWQTSFPSLITAPTFFLGGQNDLDAPVELNDNLLSPRLVSAPVLSAVLAGGSHCFLDWKLLGQSGRRVGGRGWVGTSAAPDIARRFNAGGLVGFAGNSDCALADAMSLPPLCGLSRVEQVGITSTLLAAWFSLYLKNRTDAAPLLWDTPALVASPARPSGWMVSAEASPTAALELDASSPATPGRVSVVLTSTAGMASQWAVTAALDPATHGSGAAAARVDVSVDVVFLAPRPAAAAVTAAAAARPTVPAFVQWGTLLRLLFRNPLSRPVARAPAPPPPLTTRRRRRALLQGAQPPAASATSPSARFVVSVAGGGGAGGTQLGLIITARSVKDGGTEVYLRVNVTQLSGSADTSAGSDGGPSDAAALPAMVG